jgi:uncharacterized membrane protein
MRRLVDPFSVILIAIFLAFLRLLLGEFTVASLVKLHLAPGTAAWLFAAMLAGGFVNLPVKRLNRDVLVACCRCFRLDPRARTGRTCRLYCGGAGPLIGPDLLHLGDSDLRLAGLVSIGGAGTFDGIVLTGVIAAYLTV